MNFREPKFKSDKKYVWTNHVLQKMRFYRLSESRVRRILRNPKRVEEGIAPDTVACMQLSGSRKRAEEIWVMWQKSVNRKQLTANNERKKGGFGWTQGKIMIISAWRYPGISPVNKPIQIPEDVLEDLRESGFFK